QLPLLPLREKEQAIFKETAKILADFTPLALHQLIQNKSANAHVHPLPSLAFFLEPHSEQKQHVFQFFKKSKFLKSQFVDQISSSLMSEPHGSKTAAYLHSFAEKMEIPPEEAYAFIFASPPKIEEFIWKALKSESDSQAVS